MTRSKLIVIRGNSGSGKTSAAREVRARYGRGCALIEQTVAYILDTSRLTDSAATTYCPASCPRCRAERDSSPVGQRRVTR